MKAGLTTRASCLLAAGATALACGMLLGEPDLVRAGVLAGAVPVIAGMVVARSRVSVGNRREVDPARVPAGGSATVVLTLTNHSVLPVGPLMLEDRLPTGSGRARFVLDGLAGRESRTVAYHLPALPRGRYAVGPLHIRLSDPFGMVELTRSFSATSDVVVRPIVETLPPAQPPQSLDIGETSGSHAIGSRGADDAATREYRTGDDLRKIHWRSTARQGTLMVRHEERPWQGQVSMLLDLRRAAHVHPATVPAGDARAASSLEWAVSAVASIGSHLLVGGRGVSLLDDPARPERLRFGEAGRLADHLAEVQPVRAADLTSFDLALRTAARDSVVVAVLGSLDSRSVRTLTEAHPPGSATRGLAILLDTPSWVEVDRRAPAVASDEAARALRAAGWWVTVAVRGEPVAEAYRRLLSQRAAGALARVR